MISRLVFGAFGRLAESAAATAVEADPKERAVLAAAAEVQAGKRPPSAGQVDGFWAALADLDPPIRRMRESARGEPDKEAALRRAVEGILGNIARGAGGASDATAALDVAHLVNHCRILLSKAEAGEDRGTKSRGFNESLRGLADRLGEEGGKARGEDVIAFARETFSGELPWLVNKYLRSRPRGSLSTRGSMLAEQAGGDQAAARRQAESQVLAMLYESVIRRADHVRAGTYNADLDDEASFTAVVNSLYADIHNNKVDDQFAKPKTGLETPQAKWRLYVEPLRGTDMFAGNRPDLGAILDWVNANFHREDIDSQSSVTAALPGGGSATAPSFKRRLTADGLMRWYTASQGVSSIDAPLSEDGGTVGEALGKRDQDAEDREEYKTEYLSDPENNARIRRKLEAAIREAVVTVPIAVRKEGLKGIQHSKLRKMYEMVLLIKLGFASKPEARKKFEKEWRESAIVGEDGKAIMPHIPFRTKLINENLWHKLGRPLRKGWENDKDQGPHRRYRFPWTQKALVRRDTGETPEDIRDLRNDPDPEHWKIVNVKHDTAEKPKIEHFVNWVPYTEEDRNADIKKTLDAYDGDEWFRLSLQPAAQQALKESLDQENPLRNFKPENVFTPFAKNTDWPMFRAMGQTRLSISPQPDSLYHGLSGPASDMKAVTRELGTILTQRMKDDPDAPWLLTYVAQKSEGKVSHRLPRAAGAVDVESVVLSVVDDILPL